MFLSKIQFVEDIILNELKKGPCQSSDLILRVKKTGRASTKQGVYKILKKLNEEEIITLKKGIVSLNTLWLKKIHNYLAITQKNYSDQMILPGYFTNLEPGQKFTFNFKNPQLLDSYWGHILVTLLQITPPKQHLFAYNPHYWFLFARKETEERFLQSISENRRQFLMTVSGSTYLDKKINNYINKDYFQYHLLGKKMFSKPNYYFNIIDDYIIEVLLDEKISKAIEKFYQETNKINNIVIEELKKIINQEGKNKLVISRNEIKADKFKKQVSKNFYLPKLK